MINFVDSIISSRTSSSISSSNSSSNSLSNSLVLISHGGGAGIFVSLHDINEKMIRIN